ncbi:MAG: S1C family serine protease [Hyphomicrobiaceae bacterium]
MWGGRAARMLATALVALMALVGQRDLGAAQGALTFDESVAEVEGWRIGYSKGLAGCFAAATFTDKTTIWIGYGVDVEFYVAFTNPNWRSIEKGKTYKLQIDTQGRGRWNGSFVGFERPTDKGVLIISLKEKFLLDFAEAGGITVNESGKRIAGLSLAGSRAALRTVLACQKARADRAVADAKAAPAPPGKAPSKGGGSGTGFFVTGSGHVLTNYHVAGTCSRIEVAEVGKPPVTAKLLAGDPKNDLALLLVSGKPATVPTFKSRVRLGDTVAVFGFPLSGVLASGGNFTLGNVTALAGLSDDTSQLQISAPVQPGNSGGPLLDKHGNVVGVIVAKLNALGVARYTNDVAQNVNFAIKAGTAANFLETNGLTLPDAEAAKELDPADLADRAKQFTVKVICAGAPG